MLILLNAGTFTCLFLVVQMQQWQSWECIIIDRVSSYIFVLFVFFVSFRIFCFFWNLWSLWSLWRRNRCYGDALPKAEESILWACFLSQRRLHRLLFATKNVSKKNIAYARLTHFRSFQIISVERLHPFWQKGHEFLFGSSGGFGGVVLFLPSLQVRQAISGFEAQQLQPPKKLGFREGANWIDLSGLHENIWKCTVCLLLVP